MRTHAAERQIGRMLIALTYLSVALLIAGVALMLRAGIPPDAGGPGLDPTTLWSGLLAFEPAGFLWLGLLTVISAPISRVLLAALAYGQDGDWPMVVVALVILTIIVVGIATAGAGTV